MRRLLVLVAALAVGASFASTAAADQPSKTTDTFTSTSVLTDVCPFPVVVEATSTFTEIVFVDASGNVTRISYNATEQDTFSANGKSLTGVPYAYNIQVLFDSSGNVTHVYANGLVSKVVLPDGTLFVAAGRVDFTLHPDEPFVISPDVGTSGNVEAFCAALAP
jgi:hypothetical protein